MPLFLLWVTELQLEVPANQIQIRYCIYHICIHTQLSDMDTDTDIDRCEKMISVSVKIGYQIRTGY